MSGLESYNKHQRVLGKKIAPRMTQVEKDGSNGKRDGQGKISDSRVSVAQKRAVDKADAIPCSHCGKQFDFYKDGMPTGETEEWYCYGCWPEIDAKAEAQIERQYDL